MSTYYLAYSSFFSKYNLSKQGFKLACLLAKSANKNQGYRSYKSKRTMAEECGCSISTITRALRELERNKLLETTPWKGSHDEKTKATTQRQTSNKYKLTVNPCVENETTIQCAACSVEELRPNELKVYAFLSLRVGKRKKYDLSRAEIARACKISKSLVSVIVKTLKEKGFISYSSTVYNGGKGYNSFSVITEKVASITAEHKCFSSAISFAKAIIKGKFLVHYINEYTAALEYANSIEMHNINMVIKFLQLYSCKSKKAIYHTQWFYSRKLGISMGYLCSIIESLSFRHCDMGVVTPCYPLNYRETKVNCYTLRDKINKENFQFEILC